MSFLETESAISEAMANLPMGMGRHIEQRVVTGANGMAIGEVPFDPTRHDALDIKPFSFMAEVYGEDHVDQVLPMRPMELNVVVDYGNRNDLTDITRSKIQAIHTIGDGLETTLGIGDKHYEFAIGNDGKIPIRPNELELEGLEVDELARAKSVAMICMNGLSIVLSDFHALPLSETGADLDKTLAVKVNHPFERRLPANVGVLGIGSDLEINTNSRKQLKSANEQLEARHQEVVGKLQRAGIYVVSLVTRPSNPAGIDLQIADKVIASGVKTLTFN